jgi:hypothetical protein
MSTIGMYGEKPSAVFSQLSSAFDQPCINRRGQELNEAPLPGREPAFTHTIS